MKSEWVMENGFSLIELIVTITIIGILTGLVVFTPKTFLITARDQERTDDVKSIVRRLEEAYVSQDLGYPSYPSTTELATDITGRTRTMSRVAPEAFQSPGGTSNSVVSATSNSSTSPAGAGTPTLKQYVYQPLTAAGTLCTGNPSTASPCVKYFLYYRSEEKNSVITLKSMRQQ